MRVLVTGAGGFVGRHLLRLLLERGHAVAGGTMGGDPPAPSAWLTAEHIARVHWVPLDVTSSESVEEAVASCAPGWVCHLAGQSSVGHSFQDPLGTWDVNATGTLRLLHALQRCGDPGVRVLAVSSAEVYGAVGEDEQPVAEKVPVRPVTPYGASKAAAETAALQTAAMGDVEVVIARSFNHVGPGQDERFLLPSIAHQLVELRGGPGERELRVGNLDARRDFLDVRDVVRAYLTLLERGENAGIYNVCSGTGRSLREMVEEMVELSGTGARLVVDQDRIRPVDVPLLVGDAGRLRSLGWRPEVPLERTLRDLLAAVDPS